MLSRRTPYYGLLACLVALFALGSLPMHLGKLAVDQGGHAEQVPGEEPGDEERESEQESEEVVPLRRRAPISYHVQRESRFVQAASSQNRSGVSLAALSGMSAERAAHNGVGGPLRL